MIATREKKISSITRPVTNPMKTYKLVVSFTKGSLQASMLRQSVMDPFKCVKRHIFTINPHYVYQDPLYSKGLQSIHQWSNKLGVELRVL